MTEMTEAENALDARVERLREGADPSATPNLLGSRKAATKRSQLSTTFLGIGASVAVTLRALYGFAVFLPDWHREPHPLVAMIAWGLLFLVIIVSIVCMQKLGNRMPFWLFLGCVVVLSVVIALDLWAIWDFHNIGEHASAGLTATMALLLFLVVRRLSEILIATVVFGLTLIVTIIVNTPLTPETVPAQIGVIGFAIMPVIIGVYVASGFRALVAQELDRVMTQSSLTSPRFSASFLASEKLAKLDRDAEDLLDAVATGRISLPLSPERTAAASAIATNLRFQLLEGRRETWLQHAVTDSPHLNRAVRVTDASGFAGLLDPDQRQGLLAAVWLFVSDAHSAHHLPEVDITIGPRAAPLQSPRGNMLVIPISLKIAGISRTSVDTSTWELIHKVGKFRNVVQHNLLVITIDSVVDNPAEK